MSARQPAEWLPHAATWTAWPSHPELWEADLEPARDQVAALIRAITDGGEGERVELLCANADAEANARAALGTENVGFHRVAFGDIWLRDTGPIFLTSANGQAAAGFRFNGWGGKYLLDHDDEVAGQIASHAKADLRNHDFILEGGAVEHDGEGTIITTGQCVLNPNRNPDWTEAKAEAALQESLGARKVLWLGEGLLNDHTDGHVDNLARFIAPGVVACPISFGVDDPNAGAYDDAARRLSSMTDAAGRRLRVMRIPSPGRLRDEDGKIIPASHMNFLIGNKAVVAPLYGAKSGPLALQALEALFPDRAVIGLASNAILTGGGSFHCISQQEPA